MQYIQITNWDKWQSYRKDRGQPPWIKVHRSLMRNPEWILLSDAEKGHLVSMWMLAADKDGSIPNDPALIQKLCCLSSPPNINKFIELGFVTPNGCQGDAKVTTTWRQGDAPEKSREDESREEKSSSIELPLKEDVKEFSKPLIREWTDSIAEHLYQEGYKGAPQFKNTGLKMKKDERTVLWALIQCCKYRPPPNKMWPYCTKIIQTEDGNFNEYEYGKSM